MTAHRKHLGAQARDVRREVRIYGNDMPETSSWAIVDQLFEPDKKPLEYRILRVIGRGGMGIVFEAKQESLDRAVALKVLPFHSLLDPRRRERFRIEARAAAGLQHPNIVPIHGFGEHDGICYYAMVMTHAEYSKNSWKDLL
ncbi:MAG: hypothetical protein HY717_15095 [Planctomycetes bacterium]|nr:hypothetical protein [Planctomycetota bacterium]